VTHTATEIECCIARLRYFGVFAELVNEEGFNEICEMMTSLQHPRLVEVLEAYIDDDDGVAYIISEPMSHCTLHYALTQGFYQTEFYLQYSN